MSRGLITPFTKCTWDCEQPIAFRDFKVRFIGFPPDLTDLNGIICVKCDVLSCYPVVVPHSASFFPSLPPSLSVVLVC